MRELESLCRVFLVQDVECSVAVDFVKLAVASATLVFVHWKNEI